PPPRRPTLVPYAPLFRSRPGPAGVGTGAAVPPIHGGADRGGPGVPGGAGLMRTLLVTNDFPPRTGGIQSFVHQLALRQPAGSLVDRKSTRLNSSHVKISY